MEGVAAVAVDHAVPLLLLLCFVLLAIGKPLPGTPTVVVGGVLMRFVCH
jgi:hypothetical protein